MKLKSLESDTHRKVNQANTEKTLEHILLAPDHFAAAAIMRRNRMLYGSGDFHRLLELLSKNESKNKGYKDIANKLVLIKTGHLYYKGIQVDVNDQDPNNAGIQMFKDKQDLFTQKERLPLFDDAK